ncbi:MAG: hypothetical protein NUV61_04155 [Candidatus Azambacteria bacterium]|nr:hypothetical protein [Candidatus Azambacteria bacterium]
MKAKVTFSLRDNALSVELVPENKGDSDFLALTMKKMKETELAARIHSYVEMEEEIKGITFSLNVPREMESAIPDEEHPFPHPKKRYLC